MMERSVAVLGGDRRSVLLAKLLCDEGYEVCTWGLDALNAVPLAAAVGAQAVLLPIPLSRQGKVTGTELSVEELFSHLTPEQTIFGGGIRADDYVRASARGLKLIDYMDREDFTVRNIVPTVEGALELAMTHLPVTLHGTRCLVLGYGRIGKLLAHHLRALGARVSVAARKASDLAWIENYGYEGLHSGKLAGALGGFRVVFNTVPKLLMNGTLLGELQRNCLLIELASSPGFDTAAADALGLCVVNGGGLPGRCAPETAAVAMKKIVMESLEELDA
ncbi:MAG: dipicolinate synthase [Oscillospiraceae bacterium]|nr:dipicolinate synthase [Oscillospiraceae bacterium]